LTKGSALLVKRRASGGDRRFGHLLRQHAWRRTRGAEVSLDADTFALVLQLRYEVAPSPLPQGSRIAVNEHRTPQ
jgi:hypothetical protein